jgi:hypothetical protein
LEDEQSKMQLQLAVCSTDLGSFALKKKTTTTKNCIIPGPKKRMLSSLFISLNNMFFV